MSQTSSDTSYGSAIVCILGIGACVGLCFAGLVSGLAAMAAIVSICIKTDITKIIEKFKGK